MQEESTTPDLVALMRRLGDAWNHGDLDAVLSMFAPDAIFDEEGLGGGRNVRLV